MIKVFYSMKRNQTYLKEGPSLNFNHDISETDQIIFVDSKITYQTHMGFGGAFTESAATALELANDKADEIIKAYFSKDGLNYNMGRTVIHSCDFSVGSRTYIQENDETLHSFDVSKDDEIITPMIKKALAYQKDMFLLASPWSPPAFMKQNQHMYYGGKLKPSYYNLWAEYMVKYLIEMEKRGIHISVISIQNEPEAAQVWESCHYSATEEKEMVKVLYQALKKASLDTKIVIWDHNRDIVVERAHTILKEIPEQVWGVGYHWYVKEDSDNLSLVHDLYPNHHILFTEGCVELTNTALNSGAHEDDLWLHAAHYARNIIKDSLNYSEGFIDWNLILDDQGGPNHVGNYCEAPIMVNRKTHEVVYNPSYYAIGHFSKFIHQGAKRIHIRSTVDAQVYATAYQNPNGQIVIIVLNQGWIKQKTLIIDKKSLTISLPDQSITTFII